MPTKKKRAKQIQPAQLIKLAEEHLNRGQVDEAIQNLRLVEKEVQPRVTMGGKKVSTPPHLVAVQAASAFAARARLLGSIPGNGRFETEARRPRRSHQIRARRNSLSDRRGGGGNYQTLPVNSWVNLWFDLDSDPSTGDDGDEGLVR